jgi:predicted Rossmann fold flavoprotein
LNADYQAVHECDMLIVGGGASGILAALGAVYDAGFSGSVMIIEKEDRPLRKVLASGNGRCNLANMSDLEGRYHGANPSFVNGALHRLPVTEMLDLFERWGLRTRVDHANRVYPRSMQAKSVSLILLRALAHYDLSVRTETEILSIEKLENGFEAALSDGTAVIARAVIIAAGSPASPNLGGSSSGLSFLQRLGHTVLEPEPALVPLTLTKADVLKGAEGVRFRGSARFESYFGESSPTVKGEFLVTSYGLSGIASMELARYVSKAEGRGRAESRENGDGIGQVVIDFLPEIGLNELKVHLESSAYAFPADRARQQDRHDSRRLYTKQQASPSDILDDTVDLNALLAGVVPEKIGRVILSSINSERLRKPHLFASITESLKKFELAVGGTRGFEFAQVAAGGAATAEFDAVTLMSEKVPGLFACGEILDIDGDTGGYNLLWAFSSGYQAGISAARYLMDD